MSLNARQRRLYQEATDLWSPRFPQNEGTNEQEQTLYDPQAVGIKALLINNQSPEEVAPFGRYEISSIFTRDEWHFDVAQPIGSGWLIKNKTIDRNGVPSPHYGKVWKAAGDPQNFPALGGRNVNARVVKAVLMPNPPDYIL